MNKAGFEGLKGLVRLVYASRRAANAPARLDDDLRQIVVRSAANNQANNVSSVLLTHGGWFIQLLEGPAAAVEVTFQRICEDERHDDITVIDLSQIAARDFPGHHLLKCEATRADTPLLERLGQDPFNPVWLSCDEAIELLSELAKRQPL